MPFDGTPGRARQRAPRLDWVAGTVMRSGLVMLGLVGVLLLAGLIRLG